VIATQRIGHSLAREQPDGPARAAFRWSAKMILALAERFCHVTTKCDLTSATVLEPGVYISDRGYVVLGARIIGRDTVIHDHVTIGHAVVHGGIPRIGRRVWIGPGCVVFGRIDVGDGVTLLPNTIVSRSVPAGVVLGGNPARVGCRGFDNSHLRDSLATDAKNLPWPVT
jgi:serine acetyltransferase